MFTLNRGEGVEGKMDLKIFFLSFIGITSLDLSLLSFLLALPFFCFFFRGGVVGVLEDHKYSQVRYICCNR